MSVNFTGVNLKNVIIGPNPVPVCNPLDNFLSQLWHYNVPSGTVTTDVLGQNMTISAGSELQVTTAHPEFGVGSLAIGGGPDYALPDTATSMDWTVEFALYWPAIVHTSGGVLLDYNRNNPNSILLSFINIDDLTYSLSCETQVGQVANPIANTGVWTQFAVVIDQTHDIFSIYQDGTRVFTTTALSGAGFDGTAFSLNGNIRRGGYNYNYGDPIYMDELRVTRAVRYTGASYVPASTEFDYIPC